MVAFIPDEHTLLMVVQITDVGIPAPNAACLAGACPKLALRTFPKNTSCTSDGSTLALLRADLIASEPRCVAERDDREPRKPPIGVLATPTIQTSVITKT
jgi:hypothetical protein